MSNHAQTYTSLLDRVNKKYLRYNNLWQLKNYRQKINCYNQHPKQADLYYDCFQRVQLKVAQESQSFTKNYNFLQEEYKTCQQNCVNSYTVDTDVKNCNQKCGANFTKSTLDLYENFYKTQISNQPEFRKLPK